MVVLWEVNEMVIPESVCLLIGMLCVCLGLYIRDKSLVTKENGKRCFKIVKTSDLFKQDDNK
jgi:hypothetical protein